MKKNNKFGRNKGAIKNRQSLQEHIRTGILERIILLSKREVSTRSLSVRSLRPNDHVLTPSKDCHDPLLNTHQDIAEIYISEGYINAAFWLLTLIRLSNDIGHKNSCIYPAMFCFRQYLELIMKDTIHRFSLKTMNAYECLTGHDIVHLWGKLESYIEMEDEQVAIVGKLVDELNKIDEKSFAFRYLKDTGGNRIKFGFDDNIDIAELETRMLQLYRFFEGLNSQAYEAE